MTTSYLSASVEAARMIAVQTLHDHLHSFDRYEQKGDFEVKKYGINQWLIVTASPSFTDVSPVTDFLEQLYFQSCTIDDECCLLVALHRPVNDPQDEDYIKEAYDKALTWLPKYERAEKAFCRMKAAQDNYKKLEQEWLREQQSLAA